MKTPFLSNSSDVLTAVEKLFDDRPPVLVEVRFPNMGTSSDWFLCEDGASLDAILERLGPGTEVHLNSVWDLKNPTGAVVIQKCNHQSSALKRYELRSVPKKDQK